MTQRRYTQDQKAFISHTIRELENFGAIYRNETAKWANPALAVPKPGSDELRFTVDLRGPKSKTVPMKSSMPHLDSELPVLGGIKRFSEINFCNRYWQLALDPNSQEMMSIMTPIGIFSRTRVLQCGTDSGSHFH